MHAPCSTRGATQPAFKLVVGVSQLVDAHVEGIPGNDEDTPFVMSVTFPQKVLEEVHVNVPVNVFVMYPDS